MVFDEIRGFIYEYVGAGVYVDYISALVFGFLNIVFLIAFSLMYRESLCSYFQGHKISMYIYIFFILTFILEIVGARGLIFKQYPMFLELIEFFRLIEVVAIAIFGTIALFGILYWLLFYILIKTMFFYLLFAVAILFASALANINLDKDIANYMIIGAFGYAIYNSDDVRGGVVSFFERLIDNIKCIFQIKNWL